MEEMFALPQANQEILNPSSHHAASHHPAPPPHQASGLPPITDIQPITTTSLTLNSDAVLGRPPSSSVLKYSPTLEMLHQFIQSCSEENVPLISNDVAIQLLKIQSS